MNVEELKDGILSFSKDNKIYLLEVLSELSGFFVYNGTPMFLARDITQIKKNTSIKTNLLEMETYVNIEAVENSNSFASGFYNILSFVGSLDSNEFFSFIELCSIYSKNIKEISFTDFFHAMLELFQLPVEQQYKDALGLYGELKFLEYYKNKFNIDLTPYWHLSGTFSKFDISTKPFNIEIKTTISDNIVKIKHAQLFNEHNNYLATVVCENYDSGETLNELIRKNAGLFSSLSFVLKLKKELSKIRPNDLDTLKFFLNDIHLYKSDDINPFEYINDSISELNYKYDLSDQTELSENEIKSLIKDLKKVLE